MLKPRFRLIHEPGFFVFKTLLIRSSSSSFFPGNLQQVVIEFIQFTQLGGNLIYQQPEPLGYFRHLIYVA